jgi:hypothetical protein
LEEELDVFTAVTGPLPYALLIAEVLEGQENSEHRDVVVYQKIEKARSRDEEQGP